MSRVYHTIDNFFGPGIWPWFQRSDPAWWKITSWGIMLFMLVVPTGIALFSLFS